MRSIDRLRVDKAFQYIARASTVTALSLDEMKAVVLRGFSGEFDFELGPNNPPPLEEVIPNPPPPPVDRTQRELASGAPVTPDHTELKPNGQQKEYVVLSPAERAKGFVRPVRLTYWHVGKDAEYSKNEKTGYCVLIRPGAGACGTRTTMSLAIAETYARDPGFYRGTFCCSCGKHLPLSEFVWEGTDQRVGS